MRPALLILFGSALLGACDPAPEMPASDAQAPGLVVPRFTGPVVDEADLLTPQQEQSLSGNSKAVERELGPQFVIVTVPTLQGFPIEQYGVQLGRSWGIGSRERNDGVILLVAPNERRVRIEVGYGLEKRITDPFAAKVIRERILPPFRDGDMAEGIVAGSEAIIARLRSRQSDREIANEDHLLI